MSTIAEQQAEARALFKSFHHREPRPNELVLVGGLTQPTVALEVGQFLGIGYKSVGDGKDYYHDFNARNRPSVYVNPHGLQIYILGGGYRFSRWGFIR